MGVKGRRTQCGKINKHNKIRVEVVENSVCAESRALNRVLSQQIGTLWLRLFYYQRYCSRLPLSIFFLFASFFVKALATTIPVVCDGNRCKYRFHGLSFFCSKFKCLITVRIQGLKIVFCNINLFIVQDDNLSIESFVYVLDCSVL